MLNFQHISSVLSTELSTYSAGTFLSMIIFVWLAYYITGSLKRNGFIIFWFIYGLLHLYAIFTSNIILYNPFFYFATTVILLQLNFHKLLKRVLLAIRERAERKLSQCRARNMYYDSVEAKVKREEANAKEQAQKNSQQKNFLDKLNDKLDGKFKL